MVEISLFFYSENVTLSDLSDIYLKTSTMNRKKIKKTEHLVVRITSTQLKMLSDYVLQEKSTMSDVVRTALRQHLTPNNKSTNI